MAVGAGSGNAGAGGLNFEALLHYPAAPAHAIGFAIPKNGTLWWASIRAEWIAGKTSNPEFLRKEFGVRRSGNEG